jgi:hypothetical protein
MACGVSPFLQATLRKADSVGQDISVYQYLNNNKTYKQTANVIRYYLAIVATNSSFIILYIDKGETGLFINACT